jgi:hypothetical protein
MGIVPNFQEPSQVGSNLLSRRCMRLVLLMLLLQNPGVFELCKLHCRGRDRRQITHSIIAVKRLLFSFALAAPSSLAPLTTG